MEMKVTLKRDTHFYVNGEVTFLKAGEPYDVSDFDASVLRRMHVIQWEKADVDSLVHPDAPQWYNDIVRTSHGAL
jgi:hypothetical protein